MQFLANKKLLVFPDKSVWSGSMLGKGLQRWGNYCLNNQFHLQIRCSASSLPNPDINFWTCPLIRPAYLHMPVKQQMMYLVNFTTTDTCMIARQATRHSYWRVHKCRCQWIFFFFFFFNPKYLICKQSPMECQMYVSNFKTLAIRTKKKLDSCLKAVITLITVKCMANNTLEDLLILYLFLYTDR